MTEQSRARRAAAVPRRSPGDHAHKRLTGMFLRRAKTYLIFCVHLPEQVSLAPAPPRCRAAAFSGMYLFLQDKTANASGICGFADKSFWKRGMGKNFFQKGFSPQSCILLEQGVFQISGAFIFEDVSDLCPLGSIFHEQLVDLCIGFGFL